MTRASFGHIVRGKLLLAPLTKGGNLPFRRLCTDFGAGITMSEMAYSRNLASKNRITQLKEKVLSKKGATEQYFGFQLATSFASEAFAGIQTALDPNNSRHPSIAEDAAADSGSVTDAAGSQRPISWVDINCGCPTIELSRRGLGATMLQNPSKLQKFVHMLSEDLIRTGPASIGGLADMPLTVKIRTGINDETVNCDEVVQRLIDAGVSAVTIHGRTKDQRYTKAADWNLINTIADKYRKYIPIIGNGDLLTWYEAEDRLTANGRLAPGLVGVSALMVGRGALVKPWIFKEFADKQTWEPTAEERVAIYWRLAQYYKEHGGVDERGWKKAKFFLPFHMGFFAQYRPLPENIFRDASRNAPLIQNSRFIDTMLVEAGLMSSHDTPKHLMNRPLDRDLERLLRLPVTAAHELLATALWDASSPEEAVRFFQDIAQEHLEGWEVEVKAGGKAYKDPSWSSR